MTTLTNTFSSWLDGAPVINNGADGLFRHWLDGAPLIDLPLEPITCPELYIVEISQNVSLFSAEVMPSIVTSYNVEIFPTVECV